VEAWPGSSHDFGTWSYRNELIFRPQCDAEISVFAFEAAVHKKNCVPYDLKPRDIERRLFTSKQKPFNISRLQIVRHTISLFLNHSHGFQAF